MNCSRFTVVTGVLGAILALATSVAHADSWASPRVREVFSDSREHFVRVLPGESLGNTLGFAERRKVNMRLLSSIGAQKIVHTSSSPKPPS